MAPRISSLAPYGKRRRNKKCKQKRSPLKCRWSCLFCEKLFIQNAHLEIHMNTHTRERPYHCHKCDANYSFPYLLKSHIENKHLGKRYSCNLCPSTYTLVSNLRHHKRLKHHAQSKRAIFNGIRKITKNIGIFKGERNIKNFVDKKAPDAAKDSKMHVTTKKAVPTTFQLSSLVSSLQRVIQRKRKNNGEEQVPGNGVAKKHRGGENGEIPVPVEVKEEVSKEANEKTVLQVIEEVACEVKEGGSEEIAVEVKAGGNEEIPVEVKEGENEEIPVEVKEGENEEIPVEVKEGENEIPVTVEVKEGENEEIPVEVKDEMTVDEERVKRFENNTEPLDISSQQNGNRETTVKEEAENNLPTSSHQNTSSPLASEAECAEQKTSSQIEEPIPSTSSFPSMVRVPFVPGLPSKQSDIVGLYGLPEPPPNLCFYLNGHTVPVLSLDILRNLARSRTQQLPISPTSYSQSSSSSSNPNYTPRAATSSRKQSTASSTSRRKKSGPESSSKPKRQSTKTEDKKSTGKSRTKNPSKTTVTTTKSSKVKGRKPGPTSTTYRKRNYKNKCDQCEETFKYPSQLVVHKMMHTGERPFSCTFCESRFTRKGNLIQHLTNVHSKKNHATVKVENIKPEGSES